MKALQIIGHKREVLDLNQIGRSYHQRRRRLHLDWVRRTFGKAAVTRKMLREKCY